MERISTYTLAADTDTLRQTFSSGKLSDSLREPFQALVQRISGAASAGPISIYVCADDHEVESRDHFAVALARVVMQHVPSALVVDCDFLNVGLSGLVPQRDALGFLDLLLYGSSMGVISQDTASGVRVVGAGSFPVSRRMPFVEDACADASRRLVHHARCVFFVGPMYGDDGEPHALTRLVDMPLIVDTAVTAAPGTIGSREESIAADARGEVMCVRLDPHSQPAPAEVPDFEPLGAPEVPGPVEDERASGQVGVDPVPGFVRLEDTQVDAERVAPPKEELLASLGRDETAPKPPVPPESPAPLPYDEPRYTSLVPRIIVSFVAVIVLAFIGWWFLEERGREGDDMVSNTRNPPAGGQVEPGGPTGSGAVDLAGTATADSTEASPDTTTVVAPPGDVEIETEPAATGAENPPTSTADPTPPPTPRTDPANTGGRTGGTVLINSSDIIVMDDLARDWTGWFVVHISSFRESIKAREEVAYLETNEFPVFIVFLDLGAKGTWYRVYAGPLRTREAARDVKKNLDDLQRVRFTRISEVAR